MRKLQFQVFSECIKIGIFPSNFPPKWLCLYPVNYIVRRKETSTLDLGVSHFQSYFAVIDSCLSELSRWCSLSDFDLWQVPFFICFEIVGNIDPLSFIIYFFLLRMHWLLVMVLLFGRIKQWVIVLDEFIHNPNDLIHGPIVNISAILCNEFISVNSSNLPFL